LLNVRIWAAGPQESGGKPGQIAPLSITGDFGVWSSSNPSIAEVTYAKAQGISVGQVIGTAEGNVPAPGECACQNLPAKAGGALNSQFQRNQNIEGGLPFALFAKGGMPFFGQHITFN
jgi:hypothetical protein